MKHSDRREQHHKALRLVGTARLDAAAIWRPGAATEWDISGNCQTPSTVERFHRCPDGVKPNAWIILQTRCRKCPPCLRARARMWTERAIIETSMWPRTWWITLTFKPELQQQALWRARQRVSKSSMYPGDPRGDFDHLGFRDRFAEVHRQLGPQVTAWLKRVRKEAGTRFRYLCVAEYHKSGDPHYHLLLHELVGYAPVRKAVMRDQWSMLGFSKFKLVEADGGENACRYVCKYASKTSAARVRASQKYGRPWETIRPEVVASETLRETVDPHQIPF